MIILIVLICSAVTCLITYLYYKSKGQEFSRKQAFKIVLLTDSMVLMSLYILYTFFPNNTFRDLSSNGNSQVLVGKNQKYIPEIGESIFTGNVPF